MAAPDVWVVRVFELQLLFPGKYDPIFFLQMMKKRPPLMLYEHNTVFDRDKTSKTSWCGICGHRMQGLFSALIPLASTHRALHIKQIRYVLDPKEEEPSWEFADGSP